MEPVDAGIFALATWVKVASIIWDSPLSIGLVRLLSPELRQPDVGGMHLSAIRGTGSSQLVRRKDFLGDGHRFP